MELNKEAQFVSQILQMTQTRELRWERTDAPQALWIGTDSRIFDFFAAPLSDKVLGIYEIRDRFYDGDRDQHFWSSSITLGLFDKRMNHEYTFRVASAVMDLFNEVKRQVANVDDFFDSVLTAKKPS